MPFDPVGYVETKIVDADGEVLRAVIDHIEKNGWMQVGGHHEGARPHCLVLSIAEVCGYGMFHKFAKRLGFEGGDREAWAWNDAPGRTKAEVIARLRSAAEQGA